MNIRAVMAVLDEWTLPRTEKDALLRVACRADRKTWEAEISIGRIAADMAVNYRTAANALHRLEAWGYLQVVDNQPGRSIRWRIDLASLTTGVPRALTTPTSRVDDTNLASLARDVGVEGERQGCASAPPDLDGRADAPGDNGNSRRRVTTAEWHAGIAGCPYCDECGYRHRSDGVVRCSHRLSADYVDAMVIDALGVQS